jgi:phage terminase large subunit
LIKKGVKEKELDGYFKIVPKQIPGFICIQTTYKDTVDKDGKSLLPDHIVARYESYGDPNSSLYDIHYYLTAILGYASTGRKGQILTKVKPIKLADYMKLPFREYYGQDFGTSSPAGMVGVKFDKNNIYVRQINYLPMGIKDIGKLYCQLKLTPADKIIVDHADPEWKKLKGFSANDLTIDELNKYPELVRGFYVEPCEKGDGSIREGISLLKDMNVYAVEESKDLWHEINNWVYAKDKNGNYTNAPEDAYNHLLDPLRYIVNDQRGKGQAFGM